MLLIAIVLIICAGAGFAYYEYNKPPLTAAEMSAVPVSAVDLFKNYATNEQQANQFYLNKALQVSGTVIDVKQDSSSQSSQIILDGGDPMFGVACTLDAVQQPVKPGDHITIKGICTGFLNDVILIKSVLVN